MKKPGIAILCILCGSLVLFGQQKTFLRENQLQAISRASLQEYFQFLSLANDANFPEQLEPNMQWVEKAFQQRGFSTRRLPTAGLDLVLAERRVPKAVKTVLVYVQVDGQPVDPSKWYQETPYTPTLKEQDANGQWATIPWNRLDGVINPDWRIFARSASDAKGPINMFLAALDAAKQAGIQPNYNIKVIMDCEEELGSPNLPAAVARHAEALQADWLIILDGPMHPTNRPSLGFGARGIADVTLTTYGPRVPQHSGHYGNYAPNPAVRLAQIIASMKDDYGRVTIPGFYDGIQLDEATRKVLAETPDDEKAIQQLIGIAAADSVGVNLQEALQYPSLNVRGMASGWVGKEVRTIVPATAVAEIDIRLVKESDPERLIGLLRQHVEQQGYQVLDHDPTEEERMAFPRLARMNYSVSYAAFRTDLDTPIGQWLDQSIQDTWGESAVKVRTHGGSIPISPFVNTLQIPAVIVPLVNSDNNQHSPNENVRLGNYLSGIRTCLGILATPIKP
ncbi:MAG: M20/M25/M40 family metallo-hydrolase [Lewinellaceae bacterium]|nr:M20/M25/M40 family metallo-hydrolase [Lewinellaceae bacterium]